MIERGQGGWVGTERIKRMGERIERIRLYGKNSLIIHIYQYTWQFAQYGTANALIAIPYDIMYPPPHITCHSTKSFR
jgi:hypothetical protein